MELAPSVVRKIILEEHSQLRMKLDKIVSLIRSRDYVPLKKALQEFTYFFLKHIDQEDKILRPVLKDIDSWGSVRVDRMNQDHAEQRGEVQRLNELLENGKAEAYVEPFQSFIQKLLRDIEEEERDFLSANLLKDDPITVDVDSG